ncbi:Tannase feruloyl esterase [Penicillium verhagenii]|uniref:Tannase feruloyl esterase n=1 Tax=Penicillium verhagenii TaxID=1562060 RepID=UPI002545239D|nr:Tannase feruloyl esterase [Penicillium verhagenii]KAJ5930614.1 Tannase feruloyl esterase [Penicillium verhagenii]
MSRNRMILGAVATIITPFALATADLSSICNPAAIPKPSFFGAEIISVTANPVFNSIDHAEVSHPSSPQETDDSVSFCNVTVTYTHPGQQDQISTTVFLPLERWNNRLLGVGGGGFGTRMLGDADLLKAVAGGYAAVATDGGHEVNMESAESWALNSPGNVDLYALNNFAHVTLHEASLIGKAVTTSFYESEPAFSYFAGCSTGGRQAMMLAQRYPTAYDGYLSSCPAINWNKLCIAALWPYVVMNSAESVVPVCILDEFTAAAVEACDGLDGVVDGVIDDYRKCKFDPHAIVGRKVDCDHAQITISSEAADVVERIWAGPRSPDGESLWYGPTHGAELGAVANSHCESETGCTAVPFPIAHEWVKFFLKKDPEYDISSITKEDVYDLLHEAQSWYQSIISTDDPDLSGLKRSGGKMISWHGTVDQLVPVGGTRDYYDRVLALDPDVDVYFRHFEVPGVAHCVGGPGALPVNVLDDLVRWVEKDVAPDSLLGEMVDPKSNKTTQRYIPAYPVLQKVEDTEQEWERKTEL